MKTRPARDRLNQKNSRGLLINHLRARYAFSPAMAEVLAEDALYLRTVAAPGSRQDGQIIWHAVKSTEPAGKALKDCEYVAVTLTLHQADDIAYRHQHGLVKLRRRILKRISDEAVAQGAALTQEDLATALSMDRSTVANHIALLAARGQRVITRAHFTDAGRAVTHKRPIVQQFLLGVPETEIARRTGHSLSSVETYIDGFLRVALCHRQGDRPPLISRITGFSLFLVQEYIAFYEELAVDETFAVPLRKVLDFYAEGLLPRQAEKGG
jgi:DNA-binding MarR family transcriptional regulator